MLYSCLVQVVTVYCTMDCPLCGVIGLSSKHWAETQWAAREPMAKGIIGCKTCRQESVQQPLLHIIAGAHHVINFLDSLYRAQKERYSFEKLVDFWIAIHQEGWLP